MKQAKQNTLLNGKEKSNSHLTVDESEDLSVTEARMFLISSFFWSYEMLLHPKFQIISLNYLKTIHYFLISHNAVFIKYCHGLSMINQTNRNTSKARGDKQIRTLKAVLHQFLGNFKLEKENLICINLICLQGTRFQ